VLVADEVADIGRTGFGMNMPVMKIDKRQIGVRRLLQERGEGNPTLLDQRNSVKDLT